MPIKKLMDDINEIVEDYHSSKFSMSNTTLVPNVDDTGLTWKFGEEKKGKVIETCVLYVDIRNSVELVKKHHFHTMGKVYSAFTKAVLKAAHYHGGFVRNIIGDRVMIVFPSSKCFTNSVNCALSINHVSSQIINSIFNGVEFKCGIGIDFGEMRVIKVGTEKKGIENTDNKNLVWVGYPANNASRLTDVANKILSIPGFNVTYDRYSPFPEYPALSRILPSYNPTTEFLDSETFQNRVKINESGEMRLLFGKITKIVKYSKANLIPPILISEAVFNGYKTENPKNNSIQTGKWKPINYKIKNIDKKVFGADLIWRLKEE